MTNNVVALICDTFALRDALLSANNQIRAAFLEGLTTKDICVCSNANSEFRNLYETQSHTVKGQNPQVIKTTKAINIEVARISDMLCYNGSGRYDGGSALIIVGKAIVHSMGILTVQKKISLYASAMNGTGLPIVHTGQLSTVFPHLLSH